MSSDSSEGDKSCTSGGMEGKSNEAEALDGGSGLHASYARGWK